MLTPFCPLIAQAMYSHTSKLSFAIALTLTHGLAGMSAFLPGSCFDPDKGQCNTLNDVTQQSCSCAELCLEGLAGLKEKNLCCEDFQEK